MEDGNPNIETAGNRREQIVDLFGRYDLPLPFISSQTQLARGSRESFDIRSEISFRTAPKFDATYFAALRQSLTSRGANFDILHFTEIGDPPQVIIFNGNFVTISSFESTGIIHVETRNAKMYVAERDEDLNYQRQIAELSHKRNTHGANIKLGHWREMRYHRDAQRSAIPVTTYIDISGVNRSEIREEIMSTYAETLSTLLNSVAQAGGEKTNINIVYPPRSAERPERDGPVAERIKETKNAGKKRELNASSAIMDIFEQAEARKPRHSYFINGELKKPDLSNEDLKKLESTLATFTEVRILPDGLIRYQVSPFAIPYLFEDVAQSAEFASALNFAGQEFRLFALCSSSAGGTEKQAKLYEIVADVITKCHENNPMLLMEWGRIQTSNQGDLTSFDALRTLDFTFENGVPRPRSGNEQLIIFADDAQGGYDISRFEKVWAGRISQLRRVLDNGKLERHHMRWLEFLSYSVNIQRLFDQYLKGTATSQT